MARYLISRVAQMLGALLGVLVLVFILARWVPNDPVLQMLQQDYSQQQYDAMRKYLALDEPLHVQLLLYLGRLARGDLGDSLVSQVPVREEIVRRLSATLILGGAGMIIALIIAIPVGILSAVKPYSAIDNTGMLGCLLGVSIPTFWEGIMLILLFSYYLDWLPAFGRGDPPDFRHVLLPALTVGTHATATTARLVRSCMLDVISEDYVRTARAKGMREFTVINKHALRNALTPVVTEIGLTMTRLMSGLTIVEVVFAWPGLGKLAYDAVVRSDYPMIQGVVLFVAVLFSSVNIVVDIVCSILDPRIRYR